MGQYVALQEQLNASLPTTSEGCSNNGNSLIGVIDQQTNVLGIAKESAMDAQVLCESFYGDRIVKAPDVKFFSNEDAHFTYIPGHLKHMLFELLKNSLRATVEHHQVNGNRTFPSIKIIVAQGKEDITIKVSDEGGGIPRSAMPLIWTYMYSTAETPPLSTTEEQEQQLDYKPPLAGYGYGLPLCRLYARYFGGDLRLISMEGYGTDAYLHLRRLSDSEEPLYA